MTPTVEQLRQWAAERLMRWTSGKWKNLSTWQNELGWFCEGKLIYRDIDWHPDEDANQAFMMVEKMRELGWKFKLHGFMKYYTAIIWRDNDAVFLGIAPPKIAEVSDDNPCLAIMRACYAALEEPCTTSSAS